VGALSFGLVRVPVRLHPATSPHGVQFHLLHDADGSRVRNKRVCSADGEEVPFEHVVKGYELGDGRHVEVTQGELEAFDPGLNRAIELEDFAALVDIDPIYFGTTYHAVPDEGAEHAYELLATALRRSGRVGIGRLVLYQKGHLCAVRPLGRGLAVSTLHYADEVVSQERLPELALAAPRPDEREVEAALRLIESRATDFEPRRYHDTHRERLLAFLERRAKARRRVPAPTQPAATEAAPGPGARGDLLAALEKSVEALKAERPLPTEGTLRMRPQASARQARERNGGAGPRPRVPRDEGDEPES
jgi:DNA end-binding protein Ku